MQALRRKSRKKNKNLIKAFVECLKFEGNYEVWSPYYYHGVLGFIDLVVENPSNVAIFDFWRDSEKIEDAVKQIKIETKFYSKERDLESENLNPYIVFEDNKDNRKTLMEEEKLIKEQPFSVILFNPEEGSIETPFGLRKTIKRLFHVKNIHPDEEALDYLVEIPDHEKIEEAVMNIENPPKIINKDFIGKVALYLKRNNEPPKSTSSLEAEEEKLSTRDFPETIRSQKPSEWHKKTEKNKNQSY